LMDTPHGGVEEKRKKKMKKKVMNLGNEVNLRKRYPKDYTSLKKDRGDEQTKKTEPPTYAYYRRKEKFEEKKKKGRSFRKARS